MRVEFGDFSVDDTTRQLRRDGAVVHLSPKAFDLLVALIRERPRVLTKTDLYERLWPGVHVSDASLAMVVAEVRGALGESAREPAFIRTVHRHGYAFQASARDAQDPGAPASAATAGQANAPGCWLVTASGQIPLVLGENIVGRDPAVRVWLDAPSISRRHARILVGSDGVTVEDLGSKNGTRVRDEAVTAATRLENGDEVRFGSIGVTFKEWVADPTRSETDY